MKMMKNDMYFFFLVWERNESGRIEILRSEVEREMEERERFGICLRKDDYCEILWG